MGYLRPRKNNFVQCGICLPNLFDQWQKISLAVTIGQYPAAGPGKVGQVCDFSGGVVYGEQNYDQTGLLQSEIGYDKFGPVGKLQKDPVSGPESGLQ